jgi:GrpB-like predicted nucleotidyltransferase (UPF0157 family)
MSESGDEIEIVGYDPRWKELFAQESDAIGKVVPTGIEFVLEHGGSTAVVGLPAKPVIDIFLGTPDTAQWNSLIEPLKGLGYDYWAENSNPDRMYFIKGGPVMGGKRTHHLHVFVKGCDYWDRLKFRDYLNENPQEAEAYGNLKKELAVKHRDDREAYTRGKDAFIRRVMDKIGARYRR